MDFSILMAIHGHRTMACLLSERKIDSEINARNFANTYLRELLKKKKKKIGVENTSNHL